MQENDLEESGRIQNSLEFFGRFSRFLEISGRMLLEGSGRNGFLSEMFHPPKMPQRQRNGNGMGFQRVPIENLLNADVAPVADLFFQPLLAVVYHCWFNGRF